MAREASFGYPADRTGQKGVFMSSRQNHAEHSGKNNRRKRKNSGLGRRLTAVLLLIAMICPIYGGSLPEAKAEDLIEDYIILYDSTELSLQMETELMEANVYRNENVSTEYAESLGMALVELSEMEASALEKAEGIVIVEKDRPMYGSQETSPDSPDWDQELSPILEPSYTEFNIAEILNTPAEEFSSNPYEYNIPPAITDGSGTEVLPWNVEMVAGDPRTRTYRGAGVKVAVIDSGIDNHDDLDTAGWVDFSDTVYGFKPTDNSGHGSAVAGVIYARVSGFGMIGIASDADVYSVKVLDKDNKAMVSSVIQAIEWCIQNDMDIINMSFGMNESSAALKYAIDRAEEAGILMIAAAGNSGGALQYPAAYENVVAVGAVDESAQPADFSARGAMLDLVAPGVDVQSTGFMGAYTITSGTSAAAAHVTGVAAVLKGAAPSKSNDYITELMKASAYKPGFSVRNDQYGYGIVSLENALAMYAAQEPGMNISLGAADLPASVRTYEINGDYSAENEFVTGSWPASSYNRFQKGHSWLVNQVPDTYFGSSSTSLDAKKQNKSIAAQAAVYTDTLDHMSAGDGSENRVIASGAPTDADVSSTVFKSLSPYHAKAEANGSGYALTTVINSHLKFLYELARRRLVLGSNFDMNPSNYGDGAYYGVSIDGPTKRRIIYDLVNYLYPKMCDDFGTTVMNSRTSKGWMIMGVCLHLTGDIFAHRAGIIKGMAFSGNNSEMVYSSIVMGLTAGASKIQGDHIADRYGLYNKLNAGPIPAIRLKDYLFDHKEDGKKNIVIEGTNFSVDEAQAYEDNPYFFSYRYNATISATTSTLIDLWDDTGNNTTYSFYYDNTNVPLVDWTTN